MSFAFGPLSCFMTSSLNAVLESRQSWFEPFQLSAETMAKLEFWSSSLELYNAQPIWHHLQLLEWFIQIRVSQGMVAMLSSTGLVCRMDAGHPKKSCMGLYTCTWRELLAVYMVLLSVAPKLVNAQVRCFTDNQNVAHILRVESRKPDLHALALKVFDVAVQYQDHLEPEWIPRELNVRADMP